MYSAGDGEITATGVMGMFTTADLTGIGEISDAAMGLTVEMVATLASTGSLTATIIGALEASATLSGQGTVTAGIGALAGLVATLTGTGSLTATQIATGLMEAVIYVNQSEATIEQLVEGVVQGLIDMGATGGLTAEEHAQLMKTLTTNKFLGLK
jgi:transposase